jgi:hypothetical protein
VRIVQVVADMRELKQRQWYAALRMQGLWYKYKRQYPTFVLLASLREFDKAEAELAALVIRRQADTCIYTTITVPKPTHLKIEIKVWLHRHTHTLISTLYG